MSGLAVAFLLIDAILQLTLPRRWAALPILAVACYMPVSAGFDFGSFNFYGARVILTLAMLRMIFAREAPVDGMNRLDWLLIGWALVALASSLFYEDMTSTFVNRAGMVFMACGTYFPLRAFCINRDDTMRLCKGLALLLFPLAMAMVYEKITGTNPFAEFGGTSAMSEVRNGTVRAQGAFSHSILAGSIGAASLPLMAILWQSHRLTAFTGAMACLIMVGTSGSSGPLMASVFGLCALLLWRRRHHMKYIRWGAVTCYLMLEVVMNAPAYYIISYIDLTGSSTSWHRAALIEATLNHFSEWWLAGTDYTRHWMPYGVGWSGKHIDITNYYIRMGVDGGLLLMFFFIAKLASGFSMVGHATASDNKDTQPQRFMIWALGCSLFAHAANFISVSYFDQSVMFLYMTFAFIRSSTGDMTQAPMQSKVLSHATAPMHSSRA